MELTPFLASSAEELKIQPCQELARLQILL